MIAVLRAEGVELDLEGCLQWIPERMLDTTWRAGEPKVPSNKKLVHADNGFTLVLSESADTGAGWVDMVAELEGLAPNVRKLVDSGAYVEIDLAMMVYGEQTRSVHIDRNLLRVASEAGATVVVNAYPCVVHG